LYPHGLLWIVVEIKLKSFVPMAGVLATHAGVVARKGLRVFDLHVASPGLQEGGLGDTLAHVGGLWDFVA
jgi:hypothetical protein